MNLSLSTLKRKLIHCELPHPSNPAHAKKSKRAQLWLELIPEEVCHRIATYVTQGKQTINSLSLAESCPTLQRAVVSTIDYAFHYNSETTDYSIAKRWATLLHSQATYLGIHTDPTASRVTLGVNDNHVHRFVREVALIHSFTPSQRLRSLCIPAVPPLLEVANTLSISKLCISVCRDTDAKMLFAMLAHHDITDLTINCREPDPSHRCVLANINPNNAAKALAVACRNLKALEVNCHCSCSNYRHLICHVLELLPNLNELRTEHVCVDNETLDRLCKLASVKVRHAERAFSLAKQLKSSLTLIQTREILGKDDLHALQSSTQLQTLVARIAIGAEDALSRTLPFFNQTLQVLHISWLPPGLDYVDERRPGTMPSKHRKPGQLHAMIKGLPNLYKLAVNRVCVDLSELIAIMKTMGDRLRYFETSLVGQKEPEMTRLEALILAAARYSPQLRYLFSYEPHYGYVMSTCLNRQKWLRQKGRALRAALSQLQKRAPYFDAKSIDILIRDLMSGEG